MRNAKFLTNGSPTVFGSSSFHARNKMRLFFRRRIYRKTDLPLTFFAAVKQSHQLYLNLRLSFAHLTVKKNVAKCFNVNYMRVVTFDSILLVLRLFCCHCFDCCDVFVSSFVLLLVPFAKMESDAVLVLLPLATQILRVAKFTSESTHGILSHESYLSNHN